VTDRLRYVMIVSIPDMINHQELERNLFLKKTYGEVLNLKLKAIIARERLRIKKGFELKRGLLKPPKLALKTHGKRDIRARHIIVKDYIILIYIYDKGFITAVNI